jgi:mRNA-degrading endonuclease HigB of HigAB toxin-antitoxin module
VKLVNKLKLLKLKRKNQGNQKLCKAIDKLISDLESADWSSPSELIKARPDADSIYGGLFYFFNISKHRTMILIEFEEDGEMTVVWAGNHDEYEKIFKNNKHVIKKWLSDNEWI